MLSTSLSAQIRLVLAGEFFVIACLNITDPYWPLILKQYLPEHSKSYLALWSVVVYIAPFIITVLAAPLWGYLGKFLGYKTMIIRCTLALAIVQCLMFFTDWIVEVFILRLIQGAFTGYTAAAQTWLTNKNPEEEHSFLIGKTQSMMATGTIIGPVAGGFISHYFSYHFMFLFSSIIFFLLTAAFMALLSETSYVNNRKVKFEFKDFKASITPFNSYCYLLIFATKTARWMSSSFFALYVIDQLHGNNIQTGSLYAAMALMVFLVAPVWGKKEDQHANNGHYLILWLVVALFTGATAQVIYGLANHFAFAICASILWGSALGVTNTLPLSLLTNRQEASMKGIAVGFGSSMNKLGNVLGIALGGFLYCQFGFSATFFCIAVGYLLIAFIFWRLRGLVLNPANQ